MASKLAAGKSAALAALADERGRGGARKLAEKLGISESAVSQWPEIPLGRVPEIEAATGVHRSVLRPDHYDSKPTKEVPASRKRAPSARAFPEAATRRKAA